MPSLWADKRRKRSDVNQVLARAEVRSGDQPARRLWVRARNGHYFLNPDLRLRLGEGWQTVCELLALDWVDEGSVVDDRCTARPADAIARVREIVAGRGEAPDSAEPQAEATDSGI